MVGGWVAGPGKDPAGQGVARGGIEPPNLPIFSRMLYQLSYLAGNVRAENPDRAATPTGLEPATSAVTGRRANQLRYGASVVARKP